MKKFNITDVDLQTTEIGKAELGLAGPAGFVFSFTSKMDLAKKGLSLQAPKVLLPKNPGCCHVETDTERQILYNCSNLPATGKPHGFTCDLHQARVNPTYTLSAEDLRKVNWRGTVEDQIIMKDKRAIEADIEAGLLKRPKYGRKLTFNEELPLSEAINLNDEDFIEYLQGDWD